MIRSAVAYGRSDDDSEWYQPPPTPSSQSSATRVVENPNYEEWNTNGNENESSSSSVSNPIHSSSTHRRTGRNTVQQTTIASVPQFHELLLGASSAYPSTSPDTTVPSTSHDNHKNQLMIVKFHASWCKSCQKLGYKIDQLISELSNVAGRTGSSATIDIPPRLHILNVDYTTLPNRELFVQYNVTQLPTIQIYEKQSSDIGTYQKVLDLPCPPHQFHKVRNWIVSYYNRNETKEQPMDDTTSVLDFGHDVIESSVLPILQRGTSFTNQNTML